MRRILPAALSFLALTSVVGCAHSNPVATKLAVTPVAPATEPAVKAAAAKPAAAKPAVTVTATAVEAETPELEAPRVAIEGAPAPPTEDEALPEAPMIDVNALRAEAPRRSVATGDASAQNILDPWRPYGLGVVTKTGTSITLAWRTDLESKAIIYFGKSFGLSWNGYDGVYHENNKSKFHQVTITGLSRFRSYTFTVIGTGALGMQFPTYPIKVRTHLF